MLKYQNALRAEVSGFSERIQGKIASSMKGHSLISKVLQEWEGIVNRVAECNWREGNCMWQIS